MRVLLGICVVILIGPAALVAEDAFDRAETVVQRASELQSGGKLDEAKQLLTPVLTEYQAAVKSAPQDPLLLAGLALLQAQTDDHPTAAQTLETAIRLQPRDARIQNMCGVMHMRAGNAAAAEPAFRLAVELAPRTAKFRSNYAALLAGLERWPEAETQAKAALDLDARNPDTILLWSTVRYNNGKVDEALGSLRAGVELHPQHFYLRQTLGCILFDEKQYDEAYTQLLAAHHLNREDGQVVVHLVYLASQLKKPDELEGYITQLYWLHRKGKFEDKSFIREKFAVGNKNVGVKEFFASSDESPVKFMFYVFDERGREESLVTLITSRQVNKLFRQPDGADSQPMSALVQVINGNHHHYGGFAAQPGYEQTRQLVVEILEGKRKAFSGSSAATEDGTTRPPK